MRIRFSCRNEQCPALIEYRPVGQDPEVLSCPRCSREYTIRDAARLSRSAALDRCALCSGEECFIRKNFPQKTGLLIVGLAALISLWALKNNTTLAYGVLAAALVLDVIIYYCVGVVTVCYRCRAEYWGLARNHRHEWFDLSTSEKYL